MAIETSQEIFALCASYFPKTLSTNPRFSIYRLSDEAGLQTVLNKLGLWQFRHIFRVDLNNGPRLFPEIYKNLVQFTENALVTYWSNRNALGVLGRHWVRHFFANLKFISRIVPFPAGKPVLIAGAGPSLDTVIPFIIQMREKLTVMAVDSALSALLASGIEPDVVCVLETQCWNHLDFHNIQGRDFILAADLTSYPESVELAGKRFFPFLSEFTPLHILERLKKTGVTLAWIPPLGSVGLAAVYLALHYSRSPVLITGLDFAYIPGKTHGRGTSMLQWQISHIKRTDPTPGWQETMRRPRCKVPIPTDTILLKYAEMFRHNFAHLDRLYMLSGSMDLCVPQILNEQAKQIIVNSVVADSTGQNTNLEHQLSIYENRKSAANFLKSEIDLMEEAVALWNKYSLGEVDAGTVAEQLQHLDHIYCDFPDVPPLPKSDDNFLFRAIARCRELLQYILRVNADSLCI